MLNKLCAFFIAMASSALAGHIIVPHVLLERGYWAIGGEYFIIALVGILVYGLMRRLLFCL